MPVDRPPTHFANRTKTLEIMNISQSNAVVEVNPISTETPGTFARTLGTRPRSSQSAHSTQSCSRQSSGNPNSITQFGSGQGLTEETG